MRPLTDRERRLIRYGGLGLGVYLVLFFGFQAWRLGERRRSDYQLLLREAVALNDRLAVYDDKVAATRALMERLRMDPAQISRTTLVARASAAIQQAAMQGGLALGPVRESPARGLGREICTIQIEGMGPPPSILKFLETLGNLGFPIVTESVQISPPSMGPGMGMGGGMGMPMGMPMPGGPLKLNITLVILDFEEWKPGDGRTDA